MTDHSNQAPEATPATAQRVLVLQGGGALGSYQAGAYQALCRADFDPEWVAGISIGASAAQPPSAKSPAMATIARVIRRFPNIGQLLHTNRG